MKILLLSGAVLTGLLLFSTVVCGLWLRTHQPTEPSSLQFHLIIALVAAAVSMATVILGVVLAYRPV